MVHLLPSTYFKTLCFWILSMCLITMLAANVLITLTNSQPSTTLRVLLRGQDTGLANKPMRSCSPYGGRAKPGEISRQNETNNLFLTVQRRDESISQPLSCILCADTRYIMIYQVPFFPHKKFKSHLIARL